ncbi:MAG: DUF3667 domain-containing protein [Bacteroidota bacterium]
MGKGKRLITKGRYELKFRGTECLNCGHLLDISDKYCPNCSQANSTKKLVLKDFFDEFFSNLINYDSKLLKTLYSLLIKPGTITKDYINGKRISYTNPFRFLLSLAFLYFLMFTYNNSSSFSSLDRLNLEETIQQTGPFSFNVDSGEFSTDSTLIREQTERALTQLDSIGAGKVEVSRQLKELDSLGMFSSKKAIDKDSLILSNPKKYLDSINQTKNGLGRIIAKMGVFQTLIRKDTIANFKEAEEKYGIEDINDNQLSFNFAYSALKAFRQPGSFLNTLISRLPFVVFFFLPIFAVFIFLVYVRKKYTYTDHLIFSFHNQSLMFILLILSLIIDSIFGTASSGIFFLIFGFYLYKATRKFYGQGRFKTIVKYLFLNTVFMFLALITVLLLFTGSAFTY